MSSKLIARWLVVIIVLLGIPQDSESQSDTKAPAKQSGRLYISIYLDASIPITERIGTVFIIKKEETAKLAVLLLNCEKATCLSVVCCSAPVFFIRPCGAGRERL